MELNKLVDWAVIVVGLAVVVLIGLAIVDNFGYSLRDSTTVSEVTFTIPAENASVDIGTTGTYPFLQSVTACFNGTTGDSISSACYDVSEGDADGGFITWQESGTCGTFTGDTGNCTITYLADTDASNSAESFYTGLAIFGTFMAIIVLALVGKVIVNLFRKED